MKNFNSNQLSLNLVCEEKPALKRTPNPFLLSERVKRILFHRGYSHIFNYPDFKQFKDQVQQIAYTDRAEAIADLFVDNTSEVSDYSDYIN